MGRPRKNPLDVDAIAKEHSVGTTELARALIEAINQTKPPHKKTASERKPNTPWTPKDGSPKLKLKRKFYQHSLLIDPDTMYNEDIELMNKIRPGVYMEGMVRVTRRQDRGIDIDYPIKTSAQRLRFVNQFGLRDFREILQRCVTEAENPLDFVIPDTDVYDI